MRHFAILGILLCCLPSAAFARHRPPAAPQCGFMQWCGPNLFQPMFQPTAQQTDRKRVHRARPVRRAPRVPVPAPDPRPRQETDGGDTVVEHPQGCPRTAFCGCGAALRVFGHVERSLMAAASWFRFPRAAPAPGMAAVRRHHVMVLEADMGGGRWRVYDANAGRHLTRIHVRSIAGYTIVNPRG